MRHQAEPSFGIYYNSDYLQMVVVNYMFTICNSKYQYHNRLIYGYDTQDNNPNAVNTEMTVWMTSRSIFTHSIFFIFVFIMMILICC